MRGSNQSPDLQISSSSVVPLQTQSGQVGTIIYIIRLPKNSTWEPIRAQQFMEHILVSFDHLIFQIVADHNAICWQIVDPLNNSTDAVSAAIRSSYPDADIQLKPLEMAKVDVPFFRKVMAYGQINEFVMPLSYVTDFKDSSDPISPLTQAISNLQAGERIVYTLVVVGFARGAAQEGVNKITRSTIHPLQLFSAQGLADAAIKKMGGWDRAERYVREQQSILNEKVAQSLYQALLVIHVDSPDRNRLNALSLVDSHVSLFTREPFNALVPAPYTTYQVTVVDSYHELLSSGIGFFLTLVNNGWGKPEISWWRDLMGGSMGTPLAQVRNATRLILEPRELAALWHLPHEGCTAPRITWLSSRQAPISAALMGKTEGICLGMGRYAGRDELVYLKTADRVSHMNLVGKTGVGKSTLMNRLIAQDLKSGMGVAVIDPHGSLVNAVLRTCIPKERENDVIVLDLANTDYPPPLNPLRGRLNTVAQGQIVGAIERLFPETSQYARLSRYLRAGLSLLQEDREATMRDLGRLFIDDAYRGKLLEETAKDDILLLWSEYDDLTAAEQRQIREPILSRISPFYSNPALLPILCHPDAIDFRAIIKERKILLVSLKMDEEQVPDQERDLLGALLISRLQMAGMQHTETPYAIYIDEVQRFVTTSLDEMFSEARKFGLTLTVANQYLDQLPDKTLDAILGNVGATVMFQCSPNDARRFAPYVKPEFIPEDLVNLDKFQAVVKMQYDAKTQPAFFLKGLPPLKTVKDADAREARIRKRSIEQYSPKSSAEVASWLKARYPRPPRPGKKGKPVDDESTFYDTGQ